MVIYRYVNRSIELLILGFVIYFSLLIIHLVVYFIYNVICNPVFALFSVHK